MQDAMPHLAFFCHKCCCEIYHKNTLCKPKLHFSERKNFICGIWDFWSKFLETLQFKGIRLCKKLCIMLITLLNVQ